MKITYFSVNPKERKYSISLTSTSETEQDMGDKGTTVVFPELSEQEISQVRDRLGDILFIIHAGEENE